MREGTTSNFAEDLALREVINPVLQASAHDSIHCNFRVELDDGSTRYVDFAILTSHSRIAIEIDGYTYHAEGAINKTQFDDQLSRQNELILKGWQVLRFSFSQIKDAPEYCKDQLRRLIVSDPLLHTNFLSSGVEPSQVQIEALAALKASRNMGEKRGLVSLPTGTGKTLLAAFDAKEVGGKILFVVHNNEILRQAEKSFKRVFPDFSTGFINSSVEKKASLEDIIFANIASLRNPEIFQAFPKDYFSYVIFDEFHHGAAPSYKAVVDYFKPKFMLGLTATPERTDKKDVIQLLNNNLVFSITTADAIRRGFLVPFTYYGLYDNVDYSRISHNGYKYNIDDLEKSLLIPSRDSAIIEKYKELAPKNKTIGFCVSIKHAERMAKLFTENGICSIAIHSNISLEERSRRIQQYEKGHVECVFVRDIFNEGVDFPETTTLLFLRPTESKVIFQQQLGRGLRLSGSKTNAIVLDFIGNYIGASEIPAILNKICTSNEKANIGMKPEFVYENGCHVIFSAQAIENLSIVPTNFFDKTKWFHRIAMRFEQLKRSLTPLDLFILLGDDFSRLVAAMGSYEALVDRMNSLDQGEILESKNDNFDKNAFKEELTIDLVEDLAQQIFLLVHNLLNSIRSFKKSVSNRERSISSIQRTIPQIMTLTSQACLVRNFIKSIFQDEIEKLEIETKKSDQIDFFFNFIGKKSSLRNSIAITNFLRDKISFFLEIEQTMSAKNAGLLVRYLDRLLEKENISWLVDFYEIIKQDHLDL